MFIDPQGLPAAIHDARVTHPILWAPFAFSPEWSMALTRLAMTVSNVSDPTNSREIRFMVDSGAIHSLVPRQILCELGILPRHVQFFSMVDATEIKREVGYALFTYQERSAPAPVIFGEPGDEPL